mgnify:CR=1 FL=1
MKSITRNIKHNGTVTSMTLEASFWMLIEQLSDGAGNQWVTEQLKSKPDVWPCAAWIRNRVLMQSVKPDLLHFVKLGMDC